MTILSCNCVYDEQVGAGQPDLTPLEQSFQVLSQQRSNQFRSYNGKTTSYTEWTLVLSPLRSGELIIPALTFKGESSQPIRMQVNALSPAVKARMAEEFFFDIEINHKPFGEAATIVSYVQQQLIYTERLYYAINHENATLSEFKVSDAVVLPLGEVKNYTTQIKGQKFGVYERRFAIFPEDSGELVIPGQQFGAQVINSHNRWSRGRPISVVAKPIKINIKPRPAGYPQAPWLPSSELSISQRWNKQADQWVVGEPITRTLVLRAQGLSGSQLPAIALPVVEGLKYYPDQSAHNQSVDAQGVVGQREESLAIVPTRAGRLTLPEVKVAWWNTQSQRLEYAILPAARIEVAEAATAAQSNHQGRPETSTAVAPLDDASVLGDVESSLLSKAVFWVALLSVVINLILGILYWRLRLGRRPSVAPASGSGTAGNASESESARRQLTLLKQACQNNEAQAIRLALKQWGLAAHGLSDLELLGQHMNNPELRRLLAQLEAHLYGPQRDSAFNGQAIWQYFQLARKCEAKHKAQSSAGASSEGLRPLYPQ